jgi:hypothetical protein
VRRPTPATLTGVTGRPTTASAGATKPDRPGAPIHAPASIAVPHMSAAERRKGDADEAAGWGHSAGLPRQPQCVRMQLGRYPAKASGRGASVFSSGSSVIVASVSSSVLATETAFSSAMRTTFAGSTIPASTRST